jgi:signal transduction histidine kinase
MAEPIFEELLRYVAFGPGDGEALRALHRAARPRLPAVAEAFYERILLHEGARRALAGGESRVGHLKVTLQRWMGEVLEGPWDEAYFESHCRIGRVHVRIDLPQHYMFGAMNVVREELGRAADELFAAPGTRAAARCALDKILDLELAIMLHTYREDLLAKVARTERLATFGQLVGSIGHELRNPLGVMETSLYLLRGWAGEDERSRKHLDRIAEQLRVADGIITGLLEMARDRPLDRRRVRLSAIAAEAAAAVPRPDGVGLSVEGLEALPDVEGDPGQLRQALVNLMENAVHATSPRGSIRVTGTDAPGGSGAAVVLAVEDDGPGVDESVRGRLFEPLVTTKARGIGLGLALVRRVAERHGGAIAYEPRPGGGARFTLRLPRS